MGRFSDSFVEGLVSGNNKNTVDNDDDNENGKMKSTAEKKATAASNSHKEAERRRRKRINAHIATLKSLLPNALKTDKASLLNEVVQRVKELKQAVAAAAVTSEFTFPTEGDELSIAKEGGSNSGLIKATLCCNDGPKIVVDLIQALKSVEAKAVRAEMWTIGGRMKITVWVVGSGGSDGGLGSVRRAIERVMGTCASRPNVVNWGDSYA